VTDVASTLGRSALFRSLDDAERSRLAAACGSRSYGAGQLVLMPGDEGSFLYVVASGEVAVSVVGAGGREVLLAVLGADETFGELSVIDGLGRGATVRARKAAVVVTVPRARVHDLVATRPAVAQALLLAVTAMVRHLDEQAADRTLLDLPSRVAKLLGSLASGRGTVTDGRDAGWVPVDVGLTQGELARQVGGSRQQVNRILVALDSFGAIQRLGHRVVAVRPDLLTRTA
jgi:CRP/FNR family transcriptional regulator, cyclic AMP receptor protein